MSDNMMMEEQVTMNPIEKVFGVLLAPTQTFKALKVKSEVWIPLILVPIVMALYFVLFWNSYEIQVIQESEALYASMGIEMTPEQLASGLAIARISTPITVVVTYFFSLLILAVYYFVASKIAKGELTFGKAFIMTSYISLVGVVSQLFIWIMTIVFGEYRLSVPMTSVASLLPESMIGTLSYYALIPVELFAIWMLILAFIGLRVMGNISRKAAGITIALQFLFVFGSSIIGGLARMSYGM